MTCLENISSEGFRPSVLRNTSVAFIVIAVASMALPIIAYIGARCHLFFKSSFIAPIAFAAVPAAFVFALLAALSLYAGKRIEGVPDDKIKMSQRPVPSPQTNCAELNSERMSAQELVHSHQLNCAELYSMVRKNREREIRQLFDGIESVLPSEELIASFFCAVERGNTTVAALFLKVCPSLLHSTSGRIKETPLHAAARHGQVNMMEMLVNKMDINVQDSMGNTPLHSACLSNKLDSVSWLLTHAADPKALNANDKLPSDLATKPQLRNLFNIEE